LRCAALKTQAILGERLYAAGYGEMSLRASLLALDEQLRSEPGKGRFTKDLQHQRKELVLQGKCNHLDVTQITLR
jgi:hypothetical protein